MFSLLAQAILLIVLVLAMALIKIGDLTLWFLQKLVDMTIFISHLKLPSLKTRQLRKKKHVQPKIIYPLPLVLKLRFFFLGFFFSFFAVFLPLLAILFVQQLPNPRTLTERPIPQTTKIYDRNGLLLYEIYSNQNRTLVPLSSIPQHLINATIAIEDKDFYNHQGVDLGSMLRAAKETLVNKNLQGGSTITQQLIRSAILTPEVSIMRKIKEIALALWAEKVYTKNEILEMYFNQVPYGGTTWGIEAASEIYFGKKVADLDLPQSAFLAGLPAAPSIYSPFSSNPTAWKNRQKEVLKRMRELGFITQKEEGETINQQLVFRQPKTPILAPHFVMYVRDYLVKKYGIEMVERGGLTVTTTLDLSVQKEVEEIVSDEVLKAGYLFVSNGAVLVTKPGTGEILVMVGSVDYFDEEHDGNVNATLSLRQPGSAIKVVTYSEALQKGFTPASILDDSPVTYQSAGSKPYSPVNYDGMFRGRIPLRLALGNSLNIPAVKTLNTIGVDNMVLMGKKMGITSWGDPKQYGLSITLGGADVTMLEMATIYGTLANGGIKKELNPILKITNYKNDVIKQESGFDKGIRVIPEGVAFIISDILSDNNARSWEFGFNSPLRIEGQKVSVKTGTSDNKRDNWTIGYTPRLLVATWVGNFDNTPMHPSLASGITGAAPMWRRIMLSLLNKDEFSKQHETKIPDEVMAMPCQGRIEYFIRGTEKTAQCRWSPTATPSASPSP